MTRAHLARVQLARLTALLRALWERNPFYTRKLRAAGWSPSVLDGPLELDSLLDSLPLTTKAELQAAQAEHPPFGDNLTSPLEEYVRVHQTSGSTGEPLRWVDTRESWDWVVRCWSEVLHGAAVTPGDRALFPFSFGPFLGFWAGFEAAERLGVFVIAGGGMRSTQRLRCIVDQDVSVIACTPTYALHLAEVARDEGIELAQSSVRAVIVAGEPGGCIPATRSRIEESWGARCFDHCGMTEVGPFGVDDGSRGQCLRVLEDEFIVEVLAPDSQSRAADGEGELVITNLGRTASPVVRYRTGDSVRWVTGTGDDGSACGWLDGGIRGRIDEMVIVKGNNVYPSAIESVLREFDDVAEYRVRVLPSGEMAELVVEIEPRAGSKRSVSHRGELAAAVAARLETRLLFRAEVKEVSPGSLPRFELKGRRVVRESSGENQ